MQLQPYLNLDSFTFSFLALELVVCLVFYVILRIINLFFLKAKHKYIFEFLNSFLTGCAIATAFLGLEFLQQIIVNNTKIFFLPLVTIMFIYFLAIDKHFLITFVGYGILIIQLFAFSN